MDNVNRTDVAIKVLLVIDRLCGQQPLEDYPVITIKSNNSSLRGISSDDLNSVLVGLSGERIVDQLKKLPYDKYDEFTFSVNAATVRDGLLEIYHPKITPSNKQELDQMMAETEKWVNDESNRKITSYTLSFTRDRYIVLNDLYILSTVEFDSQPYHVIRYLVEHPGKTASKYEIEAWVKDKDFSIDRSLSKIAYELGFSKELKNLFIRSSEKKIRLINPITRYDLELSGIDESKLLSVLHSLPKLA